MKKLNVYLLIGTIFVIITGTISHFVYELSGSNLIIGLFFPVNESTWEHMKLLFFPMLICALFLNWQLKKEYPCITCALHFGILLGTFLIPVIFYTYSGILGTNLTVLDISTFIISVILAFYVVYRLTLTCKMKPYKLYIMLLVYIVAICFLIFTYHTPNIGIFISPTI